jgi:hypothetical protein
MGISKNIIIIIIGLLSLLIINGCGTTTYQKEMKQYLSSSLDQDFPNYTFRTSPVGSFGVGTIYEAKITDKNVIKDKLDDRWLLAHPNTWFDEKLKEDTRKKETIKKRIIVSGSLGISAFTGQVTTKLGIDAALPNFGQIFEAGTQLDYKKGVKVTVRISGAKNNQLNWTQLKRAMEKGFLDPEVARIIKSQDVIIAAKDIVLDGYTVEIEIDSRVNPRLEAKLNEFVSKVSGSKPHFNWEIKRESEGKYIASSTEPVVLAVLWRKRLGEDSYKTGYSGSS